MDLKHIDPEFTQEQISGSVCESSYSGNSILKDATFNGFSYVSESTLENYKNFSTY